MKKQADDEPIPLYCDEGKMSDLEEICSALRSMMFVLSFHPKHSALKHCEKKSLNFPETDCLVFQLNLVNLVHVKAYAQTVIFLLC